MIEANVYRELMSSREGTAFVHVLLKPGPLLPPAQRAEQQALVAAAQGRILDRMAPGEFNVTYRCRNFGVVTGWVSWSGLAKLASHPDVERVGPDGHGQAMLAESVPFINADDVQALGFKGGSVTVAVLDTGIDTNHQDLSDDILAAPQPYHFLHTDNTHTDYGAGAEDADGHGTNVAGIITSKGVVASVGVAPNAKILPIKVINGLGWYASDVVAAIDYAIDPSTIDPNTPADFHCYVINLSLGSDLLFSSCPCDNETTWTASLKTAIVAAKNNVTVTFAASGNKGSCTSMCAPACVTGAVAVAAVYDANYGGEPDDVNDPNDPNDTYQDLYGSEFGDCLDATTAGDKITCFSNRSRCNALAAPGAYITAPYNDGTTRWYVGTSQATPHCSGVAALVIEAYGWYWAMSPTVDTIVNKMKETAVATTDPCIADPNDPNNPPNPKRVDAWAAVNSIRGNCTFDPHDLYPHDPGGSFGNGLDIYHGLFTATTTFMVAGSPGTGQGSADVYVRRARSGWARCVCIPTTPLRSGSASRSRSVRSGSWWERPGACIHPIPRLARPTSTVNKVRVGSGRPGSFRRTWRTRTTSARPWPSLRNE